MRVSGARLLRSLAWKRRKLVHVQRPGPVASSDAHEDDKRLHDGQAVDLRHRRERGRASLHTGFRENPSLMLPCRDMTKKTSPSRRSQKERKEWDPTETKASSPMQSDAVGKPLRPWTSRVMRKTEARIRPTDAAFMPGDDERGGR